MLNEEEKYLIITILTDFLMNATAKNEEFEAIKKIIEKLTSKE